MQFSVVENSNARIQPDNLDIHIKFAMQAKDRNLQENMPAFRRK